MIEYKFPYESLIGGWYIEPTICDELLNFYEDNKKYGVDAVKTEHIVDENVKTGIDLFVETNTVKKHLKNYYDTLAECLKLYLKKFEEANKTEKFKIIEPFKIQYYKKSQGYKVWHFENDGMEHMSKRHLVFMTYLNDLENGGTSFKYQNLTSPAKKGLTLIWPAYFTHTHKGQISFDEEKYIITGWYSFYE